jgi:hypothetical protein
MAIDRFVRARPCRWIAGVDRAGITVVAIERPVQAFTEYAIVLRAKIAVVAVDRIVPALTGRRITVTVRAGIAVVAVDGHLVARSPIDTNSGHAGQGFGTGYRVVHAGPGLRIASAVSARVAIVAGDRNEDTSAVSAMTAQAWVVALANDWGVHAEKRVRIADALCAGIPVITEWFDWNAAVTGAHLGQTGFISITARNGRLDALTIDADTLGTGIVVVAHHRIVLALARIGVTMANRAVIAIVTVQGFYGAVAILADRDEASRCRGTRFRPVDAGAGLRIANTLDARVIVFAGDWNRDALAVLAYTWFARVGRVANDG